MITGAGCFVRLVNAERSARPSGVSVIVKAEDVTDTQQHRATAPLAYFLTAVHICTNGAPVWRLLGA